MNSEIQEHIEKTVTNGRGYNPVNNSPFPDSELELQIALGRLELKDSRVSYKNFKPVEDLRGKFMTDFADAREVDRYAGIAKIIQDGTQQAQGMFSSLTSGEIMEIYPEFLQIKEIYDKHFNKINKDNMEMPYLLK